MTRSGLTVPAARAVVRSFHLRIRQAVQNALVAFCLGAICFGATAIYLDGALAGEILHSDDPFIQTDLTLGRAGLKEAQAFAKDLQGKPGQAVRAWLATGPKREMKRRKQLAAIRVQLDTSLSERWGSIAALLAPLESEETSVLEARIRRTLAQLQLETGLAPRAGLESARRYKLLATRLGWRRGEAEALTYESDALLLLERVEEAVECLEALIRICRELKEPVRLASAEAGLAGALIRLDRMREASDLFRAALTRLQKVIPGDDTAARYRKALAQAKAQFGLAFVLHEQGDLAGALQHLAEALQLWRQVPDTPPHPDAELLQGNLQFKVGDFAGAMATYERLLKKTRPGTWDEGVLHNNLGEALLREGDRELAEPELSKAHAILLAVGDRPSAAIADRNLGEALAIRDPARARVAWQRAISAQQKDPVELVRTLIVICRDDLRREDLKAAWRTLGRAKALAVEGVHRDILDLLELEGRVRLAQGKPAKALPLFRQALDLVEDVVQGLADEEVWQVRALRARVFDGVIEAAFRAGDTRTQLEVLERTRAAALRQTLGNRSSLRRAVLSKEHLAELEAAQWDASLARKALLDSHASGSGTRLRQQRAALRAAESKLRELTNRLERKNTRLAGYARARTVQLDELRGHLRVGEALLYTALPGSHGFALLVTKQDLVSIVLPAEGSVPALAVKLRAQLYDEESGVASSAPAKKQAPSWQETRAALHAALCDPIRTHAAFKKAGIRKLLLCQDPLLSGLPAGMQWRMDKDSPLEVSLIPSGSVLALIRSRPAARGTGIFAIGDPDYQYGSSRPAAIATTRGWELGRLRHGGEEIRAITSLKVKGGKHRVCVRRKATEASFREAVRLEHRWRSIHLVCHGMVDTWFHRKSGLALAQDAKHDGFLTVPEIFALDIKADLVTLSACDSGRGRAVEGEGVVGFPRAFLAAGAPRVIASLWPVDDAATKTLMVKFYELWHGGTRSAASALAEAQKFVASRPGWAHPRYWAAWSLWGVPE